MSFFAELKRRNVFRVALAYIIVGWLILQVGEVLGPALHLPDWVNSALAFFIILGLPVALIFAWAFEMTPEGLKKEKDIDRGQSITHVTGQRMNYVIMALMALALGYFAFDKFVLNQEADAVAVRTAETAGQDAQATPVDTAPEPDEKSIAVLPFVNMSDDASNEYFSDGITEELLNLLAKIPELRVTSRSSAFSFKGQAVDIPTVAKKLNVRHVLEGSVRKAGTRVRITAQLIEADSDVHMWSETYDRELDDVFAIQDEIAREVVTVLQVRLLGAVPVAAETKSEAFTAYLQGRHFLELSNARHTEPALEAFQKATEIDPNYAPAWVGVSRTLRWRANWGQIDLHEGTKAAREAVEKALELDGSLAEAWGMLARIQYVYDWDWYTAQGSIRTALMYEPNNSAVLEDASRIERAIGRFGESVRYAQRAVEVDPLNPVRLRNLAQAHWGAGQHAESEKAFRRIAELYPEREGAYTDVSFALMNLGRPEEALSLVEYEESRQPETMLMNTILARAFILHDLDRADEADQALQAVIEGARHWLAYQVAQVYAYRGEADQSFEWLEIAYGQRDGGMTHLLGDPTLRSLHDDPRWEPFLLKLGLLNAWEDAKAHWEARQ